MTQLPLDWDAKKHARRGGPKTSRDAALSMVTPASAIMIRVLHCLLTEGPATQEELSERLGLDRYSINKRLSDLKNQQLIEPSGETRPGESGRQQIVWSVKK